MLLIQAAVRNDHIFWLIGRRHKHDSIPLSTWETLFWTKTWTLSQMLKVCLFESWFQFCRCWWIGQSCPDRRGCICVHDWIPVHQDSACNIKWNCPHFWQDWHAINRIRDQRSQQNQQYRVRKLSDYPPHSQRRPKCLASWWTSSWYETPTPNSRIQHTRTCSVQPYRIQLTGSIWYLFIMHYALCTTHNIYI